MKNLTIKIIASIISLTLIYFAMVKSFELASGINKISMREGMEKYLSLGIEEK